MMENGHRLLGRHRLSKEAVRVVDLPPPRSRWKVEKDDTVIKGSVGRRRRKIVAIMKVEEGNTSHEEVEAEVTRTVREMKTVT